MDQATAFGEQLRRLRHQRGLSIRELAKQVNYSKSLIGEWETGKKTPTSDSAERLDHLLNGDGALTAAAAHLVHANGTIERLAHVDAAPRTVDAASVDALAGILANMRCLEDTVGAGPLIAAPGARLGGAELGQAVRFGPRPEVASHEGSPRQHPAGGGFI